MFKRAIYFTSDELCEMIDFIRVFDLYTVWKFFKFSLFHREWKWCVMCVCNYDFMRYLIETNS